MNLRYNFQRMSNDSLRVTRGDLMFVIGPEWLEVKPNHYEAGIFIDGKLRATLCHFVRRIKNSSDEIQRFIVRIEGVESPVLPSTLEVSRWIFDNDFWPAIPEGVDIATAYPTEGELGEAKLI